MQFTNFLALSAVFVASLAAPQPGALTPSTVTTGVSIKVLGDAPAAPSADALPLDKRAPPETVILSNCDPNGSVKSSNAFYYAAGRDARGAPNDDCVVQAGSLVTWEGRNITCTYPTGTRLDITINRDAQSQPNFQVVGRANNGFRGFTCRKDDKHVVWSGANFVCRAIYYCQVSVPIFKKGNSTN